METNNIRVVNLEESKQICGGEVVTLTVACAVLTVSILCIVAWKLFNSDTGDVTIPGGFKFKWSAVSNFLKRRY